MLLYYYNNIVELSTMKKYTIFGVKEAQEERKHVYLGIQTNFLEQKRWKLSNAGTFPDYTKTNVPLSWKDWGIIIGSTSFVLWIGEIGRLLAKKKV